MCIAHGTQWTLLCTFTLISDLSLIEKPKYSTAVQFMKSGRGNPGEAQFCITSHTFLLVDSYFTSSVDRLEEAGMTCRAEPSAFAFVSFRINCKGSFYFKPGAGLAWYATSINITRLGLSPNLMPHDVS